MRNLRQILSVAILMAVCLTGAIQVKKFIGSLRTTDGDYLAEQNGQVVLMRSRNANVPQADGLLDVWKISSPYLQTSKKKYLAMDQSDDKVKVHLSDESGESAKWVIEVLETVSPTRPAIGGHIVGTSKSTFRLSLFDGRFKGWYLAAKELAEEQADAPDDKPIVRELQVVKNSKQALTFDYVDSTYTVK